MKPYLGLIVLVCLTIEEAQSIGGNAKAGDLAPAIVTAVFSDTTVNLKVIGDGYGNPVWMTSVAQGTGPRSWQYPQSVAPAADAGTSPDSAEEKTYGAGLTLSSVLGGGPLVGLLLPVIKSIAESQEGAIDTAIVRAMTIPPADIQNVLATAKITDAATISSIETTVATIETAIQTLAKTLINAAITNL